MNGREKSRSYASDYRAANRERLKYQERERHKEWRAKLLEIVGGSQCKDCRNDDIRVLVFDHLRDKEANVSSFLGRSWDRALAEALKCEVVCANCHMIRTLDRMVQPLPPLNSVWVRRSKTHCPKGHKKTPENIYHHGGKNHCRPCRTAAQRKYREGY